MEAEKAITINPYSLTSYYVDILFNDKKLSNATCFFTQQNEKIYLVTNWHVVSGRNADTNVVMSPTGGVPNKLRVYVPKQGSNSTLSFDDDFYMDVDLFDEDDNRLWYEKQENGRMIDVALVPLKETKGVITTIEEAEEPFNEKVPFEITSEIFIIGFPFGKQTGYIPIWKKASVASEPELDVENLPYFFADTATRTGMSGSPVVLYKDRPITMINEKERKVSRHWTKFVGVYSGRIGADNETKGDAQLGRVWKPHVIQEMFACNNK